MADPIARPDLFKPLPKTGNVIVVDEFGEQRMVVWRLASGATQDQISAVASALHDLKVAVDDGSLTNVPGYSITVNRHVEQLGPVRGAARTGFATSVLRLAGGPPQKEKPG